MTFRDTLPNHLSVERRNVWGRRAFDRFLTDLLDAIPEGIYVTDDERRIVYWSEGAERITGYPADDVVGSHCYDDILVHEDVYGHKLCTGDCPLEQCLGDGEPRAASEVFLKREDGERLAVYVKTRRFEVDGRSYGVEVFGELESVAGREVAMLIQELSDTAVTDPLTGLFNRRYIDIVLEQHFSLYRRLGQRFGVTQIDIDGFKPVNDAFGHPTGDEALRFVASVLSDGTRKMDLLARYGGDEFVVVSAVGDAVALERLAARAVQTVRGSRFLTASEELLPLTVSAGTTIVSPDDASGGSVLARADRAMYDAKRAGGDRFCLVP